MEKDCDNCGTEWRSDKCKKCRGYDDETDELYDQPTEWTPQKDVNK